ncbi:hypothetical protein D3C71_1416290 [compost metagenome]
MLAALGIERAARLGALVGRALGHEAAGDVGVEIDAFPHGVRAAQPPADVVAIHGGAGHAVIVLEPVPAQSGQHMPARGQRQFVLEVAAVALAARAGAAPGQGGQVVVAPRSCAVHRVEQVDARHRAGTPGQVGAVGGLRGEVGILLVHIGAKQHLVLDAAGADAPHRIGVGGEGIVVADLVAQLAGHPFGYAVAVAVDQAHRLVVDLVLVVLEPACTHIHVQVGAG